VQVVTVLFPLPDTEFNATYPAPPTMTITTTISTIASVGDIPRWDARKLPDHSSSSPLEPDPPGANIVRRWAVASIYR
jgi:hypothetical protein